MSNNNNNLQTQTSSALYNAIMEAGGKDHPPMLAPGNYNPPHKYQYRVPLVTPGNNDTPQQPREEVMKTYETVSEETQKWIDAKAKAVQIILTRIEKDIYSTVDACPNAMEISQAATKNKGKAIANSPPPTYNSEPKVVADDEASSKEKEIDKLMALILMSFKKIYKPTNNNLRTSSNTRNMNVDNTQRSDRRTGYSGSASDWDSMLQLQRILACSKGMDDTDDEHEDQELEAHYIYMAKIHERQHHEQLESVNDTYLVEQDDTNTTPNSSDMSNNGGEADQDEQMFQEERELLASLIEQMKIEIDRSK
ncbi:hypothetical protein Tco_0135051 [Tanacetum coccineum]